MCDADDETEGQCQPAEDAVDDVPEAVELSEMDHKTRINHILAEYNHDNIPHHTTYTTCTLHVYQSKENIWCFIK